MVNGDKPPAIAKGTLDQRPLAHLLIYARERHLRGTMELGTNGSTAALVFSDGMLAKVATPATPGAGVATPTQLSSRMRSLFSLPGSTPFAYYDKFDALPDAAPSAIDPLSFVWHPVRDALASKQVDAIVDRTADVPLFVPASADTNVFGFDAEESRVVLRMRDRATLLSDLEKISPRAKRILYVLLVTKRVEAGTTRPQLDSLSDHVKSTSPPPASVGTMPPRSSPTPKISISSMEAVSPSMSEAARKRIRDRAAVIDKEDYFAMLGVPHDAATDTIRASFFTLAKQWHPDRLPSVLADVKDPCARVFSHLNDAYQTLVDPQKRAKYVELISGGGSVKTAEQETIVRVVEAAQLFQKAEVLFKRNDLAAAEALVRRANELDPKQAEYLALLTWIEATKPGAAASDSQTLHFIDALSQAIARNENCERAYFYRAMLYKRMGNGAAAMRDFRTVVEQNPRNVDAQREVRLHNMRGGKPQTQPGRDAPQRPRNDSQSGRDAHPREEAKGLFGGFFNKKK